MQPPLVPSSVPSVQQPIRQPMWSQTAMANVPPASPLSVNPAAQLPRYSKISVIGPAIHAANSQAPVGFFTIPVGNTFDVPRPPKGNEYSHLRHEGFRCHKTNANLPNTDLLFGQLLYKSRRVKRARCSRDKSTYALLQH